MAGKQGKRSRSSSTITTVIFVIAVIAAILGRFNSNFEIDPASTTAKITAASNDVCAVHFIDVGQGSSVLLQSGSNGILIDAGIVGTEACAVYIKDRLKRQRSLGEEGIAAALMREVEHTAVSAAEAERHVGLSVKEAVVDGRYGMSVRRAEVILRAVSIEAHSKAVVELTPIEIARKLNAHTLGQSVGIRLDAIALSAECDLRQLVEGRGALAQIETHHCVGLVQRLIPHVFYRSEGAEVSEHFPVPVEKTHIYIVSDNASAFIVEFQPSRNRIDAECMVEIVCIGVVAFVLHDSFSDQWGIWFKAPYFY